MVGGFDIAVEQLADVWQGGGKVTHDALGRHVAGIDVGVAVAQLVVEFQRHLFAQAVERCVEGVADVEILVFLAQVGRAEAHREEGAAQAVDDEAQGFAGGQLAAAVFAQALLGVTPAFAHGAQPGDNVVEIP